MSWESRLGLTVRTTPSRKLVEIGLPAIEDLNVERCIRSTRWSPVASELHVISDASELDYGVSAYVRHECPDGNVQCAFLMGKSDAMPLKITTIPSRANRSRPFIDTGGSPYGRIRYPVQKDSGLTLRWPLGTLAMHHHALQPLSITECGTQVGRDGLLLLGGRVQTLPILILRSIGACDRTHRSALVPARRSLRALSCARCCTAGILGY